MSYGDSPIPEIKHITPTDGDPFTDANGKKVTARALLIGTNGTISLRMASGRIVKCPATTFAVGVWHYLEFREVLKTNTDATNIWVGFDTKSA